MKVSWDDEIPNYYGKIKHDPNHQPDTPMRQSPCNVCVWQLFPVKTLATTPVPAQTLQNPFPIGNASFNKPWPNYHGSIRFWSNPIGTPVSNGPFFVGTVDAHKQKREAGPFPSLYTAGWVLIKEKNEVQNEVRKKPCIYTHGLWPASRKPALPWTTGSETMTICRIPAHRHGSVETIIPALCRSTRKQQQQQPSNQQPQQQQDPSSCRTQQQPSQTQWETSKIKALS